MKRSFLTLALFWVLSGCSPGGALSLLTGGGPNVAANVQAGKTNSQSIGQTLLNDQKIVRPEARTIEQSVGDTGVRAETVEQVFNTNVDPWMIVFIAFLAGVLVPSHREIAGWIRNWRKRT